jgi:hypothetical protein
MFKGPEERGKGRAVGRLAEVEKEVEKKRQIGRHERENCGKEGRGRERQKELKVK